MLLMTLIMSKDGYEQTDGKIEKLKSSLLCSDGGGGFEGRLGAKSFQNHLKKK